MLPPAERLRHHIHGSRAICAIAINSWLSGDFVKALEFCNRGLTASPNDSVLLGTKSIIDHELGNQGDGRAALEQLINNAEQSAPVPNRERIWSALSIPVVIRIDGIADLANTGEDYSKALLASATSTPQAVAFARIGSGLLSIYREDSDAASEYYAALAGSPAVETGILAGYPVGRILGLLALTMGQLEKAVAHFEEGLAFCRVGGYQPALAWTCYDYAGLLFDRNQDCDLAQATELLDESLAISAELGMRPLTERVVALQERAASTLTRAPLYPDGLTQREIEVLRLVAAGRTDREIAEELIIAVRTVTTHVGSILNKTDTANRAEAATYANQHGLVTPLSDGAG
jgi:DNA-binding CsgD family transcriptional regulator/tetratricopeptide (TPR) repeat protein